MAGDREERALRINDVLVAAVVVLIVLALTAAALQQRWHADDERGAARASAAAGAVATGVGVDLESGLLGVATTAGNMPTLGLAVVGVAPATVAPGATTLGFVSSDPDQASVAGPPPLSAADLDDPDVGAVLDRARDSGAPQLGAPVEASGSPRTVMVAAVYTAGTIPGPPLTSSDRRERLAGWVVALVDLQALGADHAPRDAEAVVVDSVAAPAPPGGRATARQRILAGNRSFTVDARDLDGNGVGLVDVALATAGAALAVGLAALVLLTRRRLRATEEVAEARGAQVRLIGDIAPLVQQSLDLAEVLPSVAVQLSDHFGLAGIALSTGSSRAGQTELFSIGDDPDPAVKAALQPPQELAAGTTLNLALQRGGRSVALLQVVAGRDLDESELESLRALSELVTAAIVNASLYASQQEALARLRELDGLKTVFLGTASHELRTPATAIAGFAGLLTSSWDRFSDEQRHDFVARIGANARSLSTVVQDLLDFSLLDRGSLAVSLVPLDLGSVVASVFDRLAPAFGEHTLESHIDDTPPVLGDQNGLERIATNLLTNAVKFSPPGTTIRVAVRSSGRDAVLEVCDQGPGVPAEERERVFARFYRGSGDAVLQTRGVGIGLSVVSEFVARMHGEVQVDDAPGGGARFTIRFPAAPPHTLEEVADATT